MSQQNLIKLARRIIKTNQYLSLGTSNLNMPWVSPVAYFIDPFYNFYYASRMKSVHAKNILKNPGVAFAIFDSMQKEGTGVGIQIKGKAYLLSDKDMKASLIYYHSNFVTPDMFSGSIPYRLFKIVPQEVYVYPHSPIDERVLVPLLRK